jgi:SPP1 gp7 family putative phage head morphogenesis protein
MIPLIRLIAKQVRLKKVKQFKSVVLPNTLAVSYVSDLLRIVRYHQNLVEKFLLSVLYKELAVNDSYTYDSPIGSAFKSVYKHSVDYMDAIDPYAIASRSVNKANTFNRNLWVRNVNSALGINIKGLLKDESINKVMSNRIQKNVELIKSIPTQYLDKVRTSIDEMISSKKTFDSLQRRIYDIGQSTENRSYIIARDQVLKLNSQLTAVRNQEIGFLRFQWQTVGDEAVRPSHRAVNGRVYRYDSPPIIDGEKVLPGEAILCRCIGDPIFSMD